MSHHSMTGGDATQNRYRDAAVKLVRDQPDPSRFHPRFADWLMTHYGVFESFSAAADSVRRKGLKVYSAFVIVNVLRWRADCEGVKFAMSNTMVPDLARLYNLLYGDLFKVSTRFANHKDML